MPSSQNLTHGLDVEALTFVCKFLRVPELTPTNSGIKTHIERISNHMPTLYQWIKMMVFLYKHEVPYATAIKALQLTKLMLQTCEIPVIHLIEVYIVPYIYIAARHHAYQLQKKKIPNPASNHSKLHHEYQSRCFITIIEWSIIKQKRLYQNQQMLQNSLFYDCMKKLTYIVINGKAGQKQTEEEGSDGIDFVIQNDWKEYVRQICLVGSDVVIDSVQIYRKKYKQKLMDYGNHENCKVAQQYSTFFIRKLRSQIHSQFKQKQQKEPTISTQPYNSTQVYATILQSFKFPILCLPKLDIYHLFQSLDPVLTYPLNQIIFEVLESEELDLAAMKQAVRILEWLIRWGDLEAYLNVVYSEQIWQIGQRMLQVKGYISLSQGQNIFPEITDKRNKLPFYLQFLNFIQIISICKIPEIDHQLPPIKLRKIRKQLQQQKFIFPQNLSFHKIRIQFNLNIKTHTERNQIFFSKIQNMNVKESIKEVSRSLSKENGKERKGKMETVRHSLALVSVLEDQLLDLILSIESKYSSIKGKSNMKLLQQSKQSSSEICALRDQILLLEQQIYLNDQQNDQCISERLHKTTEKGRKLLSEISAQLPQIYKPSSCKTDTNKNQRNCNNLIMETSQYRINLGGVLSKEGQEVEVGDNNGSVDCLSDVILATSSRIFKFKNANPELKEQQKEKSSDNDQKARDNIKQICQEITNNQLKIMNIKSITSQYGPTESALNGNLHMPHKNQNDQGQKFSLSSSKKGSQFNRINQITPNKPDSHKNIQNVSNLLKRLSLKSKRNGSNKKNKDERKELIQDSNVKLNEDYYHKGKFKDCLREEHEGLESALSYLTARSRSKSEKMKVQRVNSQNYLIGTKMKENLLSTLNKPDIVSRKQAQPLIKHPLISESQKKERPKKIEPQSQIKICPVKDEYYEIKQQQVNKKQIKINRQPSSEQKYIRLGQGHRGWNKKAFRQGMVSKCKGMGVQIR